MIYGFSFKNTRPKPSKAKQTFRFALFVAFGFWLLYQINQSSTEKSVNGESLTIHLNNERLFSIFGRKGLVTPLKSTHRVNSELILDDVTNPGQLNNEQDTNFYGVKERESIATEVLAKMSNDHELNESEDGAYSFLDENGIPELVRERLVGNESTQPGNGTRV